ncbi:unnamed protein product (macronuclear) [Paramecium tetraurelia]|uniref:Alanine racemase N-terminal domain-containing protein n=1 Tax=Paramecium tetraurelia TaxID=5888 RepID=A0BSC6_PARTE|nr:uncharacterized protein GSPATT00031674001 [Paramecium tetraurelia]CAK61443.1 unnamed protein product [Paramecium tetraurelia]|eukprot:XP_001428841.1 hypothetical protein (macronuclear) [Paramecium tetraurelia strain d4-2]
MSKTHINVETAMGRMGFRKVGDFKLTQQITNLKVVGIMTHLAREYEAPPNDEIATRAQVDLFKTFISQLNLEPTVIKHVANSAGFDKRNIHNLIWLELALLPMGKIKINSKTQEEQLNLFFINEEQVLQLFQDSSQQSYWLQWDLKNQIENQQQQYELVGFPQYGFSQEKKIPQNWEDHKEYACC